MGAEHDDVSERERRLDEVLGSYFKALAAGRAPDRQEVQAQHPDLAAELADFFADEEAVERWTASLRPVAQAALALGHVVVFGAHDSLRSLLPAAAAAVSTRGAAARKWTPRCGRSAR